MSIDDAWKTADEATCERRFQTAQEEWERLVEEADVHKMAMWLQEQGYRLEDLPAAHATWWSLLASQEKTGLFEPVVPGRSSSQGKL